MVGGSVCFLSYSSILILPGYVIYLTWLDMNWDRWMFAPVMPEPPKERTALFVKRDKRFLLRRLRRS